VARALPPVVGAPIDWREADALAMPLPEAAFDVVLCQQGLQQFPDRRAALREIRRVLRPGGRLLFMEHIRSDSPRWARWQDRLNPPWRAFAEGCNCNRPTLDVIDAGPLALREVQRGVIPAMVPLIRPLATGSAVAA